MIPVERENELLFYWEAETPEAWSQEWREELSVEERALVEEWDAQWLNGFYGRGKDHGTEE